MKLPLVDHDGKRVVFAGPGAGHRMLAESRDCRVGVLMWFHKHYGQCLLKIE